MAQYKVPQDVEADDKLIGPFSFRQFVYLLIAAGLVALAVGLFQLFPLLAIIPVPPILLFVALALPLKKDQPMETYLAAIVSYYLKPRKRIWAPGQSESTIKITAPKKVEENRTREITGEEATHRLSFLVDIVDTGGYAIKGAGSKLMREDLIAEANAMPDMFETSRFDNLENKIAKNENVRHEELIKEMREAIDKNENIGMGAEAPKIRRDFSEGPVVAQTNYDSTVVVAPTPPVVEKSDKMVEKSDKNVREKPVSRSIIELANNPDFSVATIAKEANRINRKDEGEVFISLH
ncbi:PrgI family protein [Candidatus Saccharibacteria bacterium]|nr:PrgI family protein [Candidatus Saccharibacteria bacterium]